MNTMKLLTLIFAMILFATVCFAEWKITGINTTYFIRKNTKGPQEIKMTINIRNTSNIEMFIFGEDFGGEGKFYLVESFIKNTDNDIWERQNVSMGDGMGTVGWIKVKPGQAISVILVVYRKYVGRQMLLTFRHAYSKGDNKGSEILLGPFEITEPKTN